MQEELPSASQKERDRLFAVIATCPTYPDRELAYLAEPLSLLRIAATPEAETEDSLVQHHRRFAWMKGPVGIPYSEYTIQDYRERVLFLRSQNPSGHIKQILKERDERERACASVLHTLQSNSLQQLCHVLRVFIFLRTYTTEASDHLFFAARKTLFAEIAKRLAISVEDLLMLDHKEIIEALQKENFPHNVASERKESFAIIWKDGAVFQRFGKSARQLQERARTHKNTRTETPGSSLTGYGASPGRHRGVARIVRGELDFSRVDTGDVLVATMTTPDLTAAIERAGAIVTDEGGVTCHAAIISRERGVPCVVGTTLATSLFHDGDMLEVDGDHGTVSAVV